MRKNIAIIIPALNPNNGMVELIENLKKYNFNNIFVVDDGSNEDSQKYFKEIVGRFHITLLKHNVNQGKGSAIKTAIKEILNKDFDGIITVDADGQHLAEDVKKVEEKMTENKIIFGIRDFKNQMDVPLGSKIGNKFSTWYLKLVTGKYLSDTQTGLRGIPKKYFNMALDIEGSRYEYEMNFLKQICLKNIEIDTVSIQTIYKDRIKNFRIFRDSYIIYKEFFRTLIFSIICAVTAIILFWVFVINN